MNINFLTCSVQIQGVFILFKEIYSVIIKLQFLFRFLLHGLNFKLRPLTNFNQTYLSFFRSRDRQISQKGNDGDDKNEQEGLLDSYKPTFFDEISRRRRCVLTKFSPIQIYKLQIVEITKYLYLESSRTCQFTLHSKIPLGLTLICQISKVL